MSVVSVTGNSSEVVEPTFKPLPAIGIAVAASVILGAATSFVQGFLPDTLRSFANSASGWTIVTGLIVWCIRSRTCLSALLGALSFVGLVMGYTWTSQLRGYYYNPLIFGVIGIVVGPFVGVAAAWLRRREWRAALGTSLLAGICVGECIYGLTIVSENTHPLYWILVGVLGLALLIFTIVRKVSTLWLMVLTFAAASAVATAFVLVYNAVGNP